ncbi:MAG: RDD family protein [Candidatus Hermodarchaeota archaeon]
MSINYCPKCGAELEPETKFCSYCGADLRTREPTVKTPTQATGSTPASVSLMPQKQQVTTQPAVKTEGEYVPSDTIYASFGQRFGAFIVDLIILLIPGIIFAFTIRWPYDNVLIAIVSLLYFWGLETYNNGQTIGKAALGIRTVDETTLEKSTAKNYFINNLLKVNGFTFILDVLIGIIVNSSDPHKRFRIMQNASDTVVIKVK